MSNMFRTATFAALSLAFASSALAGDEAYEEWWLCVNECGPDDAGCVDDCTDDYNNTSTNVPLVELELVAGTATCDRTTGTASIDPVYGIRCPEGTTLTPFEMPVYDERGLFVVDHETVWFCIDDDLTPAG